MQWHGVGGRFATVAGAALAGVALLALGACSEGPSDFQIAEVQAATPSCEDRPDAPFIGRVSGQQDLMPGQRPVSYVGCFKTMAGCQAWNNAVVGTITGRVIYNECRPR